MKAGHEYTGRNLSGSPVARGYTQGQLEVSTWWSYCIPPDIAGYVLSNCMYNKYLPHISNGVPIRHVHPHAYLHTHPVYILVSHDGNACLMWM